MGRGRTAFTILLKLIKNFDLTEEKKVICFLLLNTGREVLVFEDLP